MKRWFADAERFVAEQVECAERGYPHLDAKGRKQFNNSHYDDERDAWLHLAADINAGVAHVMREIRQIDGRREVLLEQLYETSVAQESVRKAMLLRWGADGSHGRQEVPSDGDGEAEEKK